MAAQLIDNLSATDKPRQSDQDDLKALMAEVSNAENSGVDFSSLGAKLEHKHKLIYVFTRTVLEKLAVDDPFIDAQRVAAQAYEALDVFITLVKEIPEVLAYVLGPNSTFKCRGQEPLWIWLFPRILALLGRRHCEKLTEKIKDFFYISFQAVARSPKLWNLASFFFRYLKECATSMSKIPSTLPLLTGFLALFGHCHNPNSVHRIDATLPCDHIETSIFSNDKDDDSQLAISHCTYLVHDPAVGLWHVTNILSMLVDISMESATSYDATPAFQDYLAWMLDSFLVSHDLQRRWRINPQLQESCKKSAVMSFCAVHALMSSLRGFLTDSMLRKGYVLLSILCADLLEHPADISDKLVRSNLCSSIMNLATVCTNDQLMHRVVCLHLVPAIEASLFDEVTRANLGKDFQVRSSLDTFVDIS
jgi:serine/threonine-protein kinase ATR